MTTIRISLTAESERVIERHAQRPRNIRRELTKALRQGLTEAEGRLKKDFLSGTYTPGTRRGGRTPVGLRSGSLRQAVVSKLENALSGFVGVIRGPASRYAATILGDQTKKIVPRRGKFLAIPIADGLTRSGQPRFPGGPRSVKGLRIFMSKAGNLVGFLPTGGSFKRGAKKGKAKGKLLFVFKKSVTVQGTDALAKSIDKSAPRITELLRGALVAGMGGAA